MEEECFVGEPSYYSVLGVSSDSSDKVIRRAYKKLAMKWHPDKWARRPSLLSKAKRKFQQIQEAYSVLSDPSKRMMYDSGFYEPHEEVNEGFADFLQEMASMVDNVKKEGKVYSMNELQGMFDEMTKCFDAMDSSGYPQQGAGDAHHQWYPM